MKEEWKDVVGFNGKYKVSNLGRVKSFVGHEKFLSPNEYHGGYLQVRLSINGESKGYKLHRLVAEAFLENPENKPVVNHLDGNPKNNCLDNLEWATYSENEYHAFRTGLRKNGLAEESKRNKLTWDDVRWIRNHYIKGDRVWGSNALGRRFGVSGTAIRDIISNKRWIED